jgi:hypothetical protein
VKPLPKPVKSLAEVGLEALFQPLQGRRGSLGRAGMKSLTLPPKSFQGLRPKAATPEKYVNITKWSI